MYNLISWSYIFRARLHHDNFHNVICYLQQGKKTEISTKISQVKNGVTDFTAHIEAMRSTRDLKLADIERIQKDLQVLGGGWGEVG